MGQLKKRCQGEGKTREERGVASLEKLPYSIHSHSYSCPDGEPSHIQQWGKGSSWKAGRGGGWVILRLEGKALLSFVRLFNQCTSTIDISISVKGTKARDFVKVKTVLNLPHHYQKDLPIGHLPCKYIKLNCSRGYFGSDGSDGGSLFSVQLVGLATSELGATLGPAMEKLLHLSTEQLLFGSSLAASLPMRSSKVHLKTLTRPHSRFSITNLDVQQWADKLLQAQGDLPWVDPVSSHEMPSMERG
ncbi:unnamed protein product [Chrysoparadoxa australica]